MPPKRKAEGENGTAAAKKGRDEIPSVEKLDFSSAATTSDGKPWNVKIASWNINGVRAWFDKNGHSYVSHEAPDVLCLQETKCSKDKVPAGVKVDGYHTYWVAAEKDGYSGTALYSKAEPLSVTYGIDVEEHDGEGRVITAEYESYYVVAVYTPNAGRGLVRLAYRLEWEDAFRDYVKGLDAKKTVVICGDLNVAHTEIDLKNPKSNKKNAGFTQEERNAMTALLGAGFVDSFRELYPEREGAYTFWTYMMNARAKDVGWRIDYCLVSTRLRAAVCDSLIRKEVMGSDHCPVVLLLHL